MKIRKSLIYFLLFIIGTTYSQNVENKIPLIDFISEIESKYEVKFSYAVKDLSQVTLLQPQQELSLIETIAYLNDKTLLNFKTIDNRYITVSVLEKMISICGTLFSKNSNTPLLGASIALKNSTRGTTTNVNGAFSLENIPLNSIINLSYLGYESEIIASKLFFSENNSCKKIYLKEIETLLNEIIITKYLTTGLQKRLDGSTVLNTENFGILPGLIEPDIMQSIQVLPGVESSNESIANINVRGGTNDQNLILWDGLKMYHSGHFFGLISAYNPNLTEKVIVTKNGTSSAFSDGVSSTINMFTKNELTHKIAGGAGVNLISGDVFLELPITKKLELHISGRRSFTDAFSTPTYTNYFDRSFQDSEINTSQDNNNSQTSSNFLFYDTSAKLLFDFNENHKFRANTIYINNDLDYSESINNAEQTASKKSNLQQENLGFGASWQANWSKKFSTQTSVYYSRYHVISNDFRVETDQRLIQGNAVLDTGVKIKSELKINEAFTLSNGYQFNETGISNNTSVSAPEYFKEKKDVLLNHSIFSETEYKKNAIYLRAGVRLNYFQKFNKLLLEPRLNFRYKFSNHFAVTLAGEFKNQSATQIIDFQDDFLGVENRRWILANQKDIPISVSKQSSIGLELNKNNFNVSIEAFYKLIDGITASNQGFYNNFQYINASGSYLAKGIEFLANKTSDKYSTFISYTYSTNDYEFNAFTPNTFPNNVDIRHSFSAAFSYDIIENIQISLGGSIKSGLPYTKPVEGNETIQNGNNTFVNYDKPNNENLDPYLRLDASLNYKFSLANATKASLRVGIINLTNENNSINRYYEVDSNDSNKANRIDNKSLGFNPNVSFRVHFK